jgi:hypothetical protein
MASRASSNLSSNKVRFAPVIAIPLAIVAAAFGASIYMAFVWRP